MKRKQGRPRIYKELHPLLVNLTDDQHKRLEELHKRTHVPKAIIIRLAIDSYLDAHMRMKIGEKQDNGWEPL